MKIKSAKIIEGEVKLPGDKSISHRAALFAAIADGETRIENFATSADCASTLRCLQNLGVVMRREGSTVWIKGVGKNGFREPPENLDGGNSGTTVRLLAGILAGQNFKATLSGDESLSKRPMKRIIEPLTQMGAKIEAENNLPPLKIYGKNPLRPISYELPVASAQVKSCVLLAGLFADGTTEVIENAATRNHTENMLRFFGANITETFDKNIHRIMVAGDSKLSGQNFSVPSDISSAAFFLVAASCLKNSNLLLKNVGLNPTRRAIVGVLQNFGADIAILNEAEICNESVGDLRVRGGRAKISPKSKTNKIEGGIIANLIDEIPVLAIFGTQLENGLEIRGAQELRVKESDRIAATVENLRRMGASVEEFPDGLRIKKSNLKGAEIESYGDHRIAMAFAVAALFADGETKIKGAECVAVSFPEFFQTLGEIIK
ncbi:MAG: 3-phosphoshikimate 1-carboxyvinyltransferase [Pyrinomonadaceae bacterium]